MTWTDDAEALLKEVPFFVRPAARKKIEGLARDAGAAPSAPDFYAQPKARFGHK